MKKVWLKCNILFCLLIVIFSVFRNKETYIKNTPIITVSYEPVTWLNAAMYDVAVKPKEYIETNSLQTLIHSLITIENPQDIIVKTNIQGNKISPFKDEKYNGLETIKLNKGYEEDKKVAGLMRYYIKKGKKKIGYVEGFVLDTEGNVRINEELKKGYRFIQTGLHLSHPDSLKIEGHMLIKDSKYISKSLNKLLKGVRVDVEENSVQKVIGRVGDVSIEIVLDADYIVQSVDYVLMY